MCRALIGTWLGLSLLLLFFLLVLFLVFELFLVESNRLTVLVELDELSVKHICKQHLKSLSLGLSKHNVFRLKVSVDNLANPMQVVQAQQGLLGNLPHDGHWNAVVVILLDLSKQILTEHFKRHDGMSPVGSNVEELVKHL